jgi:hypothetical protein
VLYWGEVEVTLRLTDSQYVLVSSTLVGLATRYYFLSECCRLKFSVLFLWGALSDERTGLQFAVQSLNGPSRAEPVTILNCLIWDSPNLEGQVPIFISPRNRVVQLYPRALGHYNFTYQCYTDNNTRNVICRGLASKVWLQCLAHLISPSTPGALCCPCLPTWLAHSSKGCPRTPKDV